MAWGTVFMACKYLNSEGSCLAGRRQEGEGHRAAEAHSHTVAGVAHRHSMAVRRTALGEAAVVARRTAADGSRTAAADDAAVVGEAAPRVPCQAAGGLRSCLRKGCNHHSAGEAAGRHEAGRGAAEAEGGLAAATVEAAAVGEQRQRRMGGAARREAAGALVRAAAVRRGTRKPAVAAVWARCPPGPPWPYVVTAHHPPTAACGDPPPTKGEGARVSSGVK